MLVTMILALAADADVAALVSTYRARTAAVLTCDRAASGDEILVCGRRDADRYRVPLTVADAGDRAMEGVPGERARLMHRTTPIEDLSPFLVGGGMAGATVSQTFGAGAGSGESRVIGWRPLAP